MHSHTNCIGRLKWPSAIARLTVPNTSLMSALVICKLRKDCGYTWHWMSLLRPGNIKQHRTLFKFFYITLASHGWSFSPLFVRLQSSPWSCQCTWVQTNSGCPCVPSKRRNLSRWSLTGRTPFSASMSCIMLYHLRWQTQTQRLTCTSTSKNFPSFILTGFYFVHITLRVDKFQIRLL